MAINDTNRVSTTEPGTTAPARANDKMELREAMGDRRPSVVRETDAVSTSGVALPAIAGITGGGVVGAIAGLLLSLIPGLGLEWWAGLAIGFFVGAVLGGFVSARFALNTADGGASGTYRFPGGGNQPS